MNLLSIRKQTLSELYDEEYKEAKMRYDSCNHIIICNRIYYADIYKFHRLDKVEVHSCIKCGLNTSTKLPYYHEYGKQDAFMHWYPVENSFQAHGIDTGIMCDFDLAQAIYLKIKEAHPELDDHTVVKYLEIALDDIRNTKVSDERKASRAKRLLLKPQFNSWNPKDVEEYPISVYPLVHRFPEFGE